MKMQGPKPAFVDGLYAKFYALASELLCVGSKCNSSSVRPDSFHPAEAGRKSSRRFFRNADCSRPRAAEGEEFLDPGVRIHHGRKP